MKKIYTLLSFLLIGSFAVAQVAENTTERSAFAKQAMDRSIPNNNVDAFYGGERIDIYTTDFANELPSDWSEFTETGPCNWVWTDVGHTGEFPSASLESTTADNGWMILDSDLCGAEGGDVEVAYLVGPSVDCSSYDAVAVRFEQYFRRYAPAAEITTLEVSVDGGTEWSSFEFNQDIDQEGTANPAIAQQNITDLAAGEADVRFRFRWEGTWGYGWQIDDFAVIVPLDNDVTLSNVDYQGEWISADEDNYRDLAYSVYPVSQVRDMTFRGTISNNGGLQQTNVMLQVDISGPDGYAETLMSDPTSIEPAESAVFSIPNYTPPATVGEYMVNFSTVQDATDENDVDNVGMSSFQISDGQYARDRGVAEGEFTNFDDDYKLGTTFYMEVDEVLHCIGVALGTTSIPGTSYTLELLDGIDLEYITETELATVPDIGGLNELGDSKWEWSDLASPALLTEATDYCAVLNHFGGDDDVVARLSGTSPAQTSFIYEGSETTWFFVTSTPMVRLGLSEEFCLSVGLEEAEQVAVQQLFPNPTSGQTTLEYNLLETAEVNIFVFDQQGRIVFQQDMGTQPVGEYRFNYDFNDLASGMYTLTIMVDDKAVNEKLVIK